MLNKIASTNNQQHRFNAATYPCLVTCSRAFDWCRWTLTLRNRLENHPLNCVILPLFPLLLRSGCLFFMSCFQNDFRKDPQVEPKFKMNQRKCLYYQRIVQLKFNWRCSLMGTMPAQKRKNYVFESPPESTYHD